MDFGPGAENRPKRQQAQRNSRASGMDGLRAAPFRQFFATSPVACPYIPGRAERKLIVELGGSGGAAFYDDLSRAGFRRSHHFAYRPGVPRLHRLRAGADRRRAFSPIPARPAACVTLNRDLSRQSRRRRMRTLEQFRAVLDLSALATWRQRHGINALWRLSRDGRGHAGTHRHSRSFATVAETWSRHR